MDLPEKFNHPNHESPGRPSDLRTGRRLPRRTARLLGAVLVFASGSLLGAQPAPASDGHATALNWNLPYGSWTHQGCIIYSGIAIDDLHARPGYHFMGGGQVYCEDGAVRNISFTVRQYADADDDHSSGVSEVGDAGAFTGETSNAFEHTGPVCKVADVTVYFQTMVQVNIDGDGTAWLEGPWISAGDGCVNP